MGQPRGRPPNWIALSPSAAGYPGGDAANATRERSARHWSLELIPFHQNAVGCAIVG